MLRVAESKRILELDSVGNGLISVLIQEALEEAQTLFAGLRSCDLRATAPYQPITVDEPVALVILGQSQEVGSHVQFAVLSFRLQIVAPKLVGYSGHQRQIRVGKVNILALFKELWPVLVQNVLSGEVVLNLLVELVNLI